MVMFQQEWPKAQPPSPVEIQHSKQMEKIKVAMDHVTISNNTWPW